MIEQEHRLTLPPPASVTEILLPIEESTQPIPPLPAELVLFDNKQPRLIFAAPSQAGTAACKKEDQSIPLGSGEKISQEGKPDVWRVCVGPDRYLDFPIIDDSKKPRRRFCN